MVKNYLKANSGIQKTLLCVLGPSHLGQAFTPAWANSVQECEMVKNQIKGTYCTVPILLFYASLKGLPPELSYPTSPHMEVATPLRMTQVSA